MSHPMTLQALLGYLSPGDHIERPMKTGVPNHHGIVESIGSNLDDTYVYHFYCPTSKSEAKVARTTLGEFMVDETILLKRVYQCETLRVSETIAYMRSWEGKGDYNLMNRNCELICRRAKLGPSALGYQEQVGMWMGASGVVGLVAGIVKSNPVVAFFGGLFMVIGVARGSRRAHDYVHLDLDKRTNKYINMTQ